MRASVQAALIAVLTLGACEVALRVAGLSPEYRRALVNGPPAAHRMAQLEIAIHMNDSAMIGVPLAHDAELGWTVRPSQSTVPIQTTVDEFGLRAASVVDPRVPFDGQRVAVVGDSFAFGADVADDETFAAVLGARSPDRQVLNFGVVGYGHDQIWLRTRRDVLPTRPSVVVLPLLDCDIPRNAFAFTVWFKPRFALRDDALVRVEAPPATKEAGIHGYQWSPRVFDAWHIAAESAEAAWYGPDRFLVGPPGTIELTTAILQAWARDVVASGATPVLMFALGGVTAGPAVPTDTPSPSSPVFDAVCADPAVRCVDARAAMSEAVQRGVPVMSPHGAHWSAELHVVVADVLEPVLDALRPPADATPGGTP